MSNANNLKNGEATQFRTGEEQVEIARQGGIASGKARREKKTIQAILDDYLAQNVDSNKNLKKIAESVGIDGKQSIKELMAAVCIINTLKKGDVDKLQKLCEILGEDNNTEILEDMSEAEADVFGTD